MEVTAEEKTIWQAPFTDKDLDLLGLRPVTEGGLLFCGVSEEAFAINGVTYQWPRGTKITWGLGFSKLGTLSDMDVKDVITAALKEISSCCDFSHAYVPNVNMANLQLYRQTLDGPSGVLADCQIPVGNVNPSTVLRMRFDDTEGWVISETPGQGQIDFYRVFLHEAEHAHGLGHKPANIAAAALIAPIYSRTIRSLQPADIAEFVRRYGAPTVAPPVAPPPAALPVTVTIEQGNKKWGGQVQRIS